LAIILPHSVFFHFPKTGGYFIREVIRRSGVPAQSDDPKDHSFHAIDPGAVPSPEQQRFRFIFIRHPLEWYTSYWNHRTTVGWEGELHPGWNAVNIYQARKADDFTGFIEQVLDEGVPFISQHRQLFERMDAIGHLERLKDDLCRIFAQANEDISCELVRSTPGQNQIPYRDGQRFRLPRELYDRMLELESWAFQFFGYAPESRRFELY
jgi:hypothetical protein